MINNFRKSLIMHCKHSKLLELTRTFEMRNAFMNMFHVNTHNYTFFNLKEITFKAKIVISKYHIIEYFAIYLKH